MIIIIIIIIIVIIINLVTKSRVPLVRSIRPPVGRTSNPTNPIPVPLKNPNAPSSFTPLIGWTTTPVTPSATF